MTRETIWNEGVEALLPILARVPLWQWVSLALRISRQICAVRHGRQRLTQRLIGERGRSRTCGVTRFPKVTRGRNPGSLAVGYLSPATEHWYLSLFLTAQACRLRDAGQPV